MVRLIARLDSEDLVRFRYVCARWEALNSRPEAFSASEAVQIHLDYFNIIGELAEKYDFTDADRYRIDPATGAIFVYED